MEVFPCAATVVVDVDIVVVTFGVVTFDAVVVASPAILAVDVVAFAVVSVEVFLCAATVVVASTSALSFLFSSFCVAVSFARAYKFWEVAAIT